MMFSVQLEDTASIDRSFECSNPKYTEYYRIHAFNDMQTGIGKTWVLTYKDKAIGFISIAMAHIRQERHEDLQDNRFGNIPALLIGHLATHQDYENRGVGTRLLAWAIKKATEYSKIIGCSIVMLSPKNKKNRGQYKKRDFVYVPHDNKERDAFFFGINHNKRDSAKKRSDKKRSTRKTIAKKGSTRKTIAKKKPSR